tara:strand:+ start:93 stop:446 length:354 start_codon:yes stop_codon:yes gene_type:complete
MNKISSIVLYDNKCGFCTKIANFLKKKDKENTIKWIEIDSEEAKEIILNLQLEKHIDSIIYIKRNNHLIKSAAVIEILKILDYKTRFIIQLFPISFCDFIYDKIATNRYLFNTCKIK